MNAESGRPTRFLSSLRWLFSAVLIGAVFWWVDLDSLVQSLLRMRPLPLFLAIALLMFHQVLMAARWEMILRPYCGDVRTSSLLRITFVSSFIVNFLPSSLSADAARTYFLRREKVEMSTVLSSIVIDRFVGFAVLLTAGSITGLVAYTSGRLPAVGLLVIGILAATMMGAIVVLYSPWCRRAASLLTRSRWKIVQDVGDAISVMRHYQWTSARFFRVMFLSAGMFLLRVYTFYLAFRAVGGELNYGYFLLFVPLMELVRLVPVSVAGLGVQEGGWVYLLVEAGVPSGEALLFALVVRFVGIIVSLPGGVLIAFDSPSVSTVEP